MSVVCVADAADLIRASAQSFYQRHTQQRQRPLPFSVLSDLCTSLNEELQAEVTVHTHNYNDIHKVKFI